jgi:hypothetical protein
MCGEEQAEGKENFITKSCQINLHDSKADIALLCRKHAVRQVDVALLQEP